VECCDGDEFGLSLGRLVRVCGCRVWEDLCLGDIFAGVFDVLLGSHPVDRFLREVMISVSYECVA
jgi:hypothetical protein